MDDAFLPHFSFLQCARHLWTLSLLCSHAGIPISGLGPSLPGWGGVWHRPMVDPIALHCVCGCQEPILHACKCKCQAASRALSSATAWEYQVGRTAVFPNVGDGKWGANTIFPQPCKALSHFTFTHFSIPALHSFPQNFVLFLCFTQEPLCAH